MELGGDDGKVHVIDIDDVSTESEDEEEFPV